MSSGRRCTSPRISASGPESTRTGSDAAFKGGNEMVVDGSRDLRGLGERADERFGSDMDNVMAQLPVGASACGAWESFLRARSARRYVWSFCSPTWKRS